MQAAVPRAAKPPPPAEPSGGLGMFQTMEEQQRYYASHVDALPKRTQPIALASLPGLSSSMVDMVNRINDAAPVSGLQADYYKPLVLPPDTRLTTGMQDMITRIQGDTKENLVNDHAERIFNTQIPDGVQRLGSMFARMQTQSRFDGLKPVVGTLPNMAFPGMPYPTETFLQTPPVTQFLTKEKFATLDPLEKQNTITPEEEARKTAGMPMGTRVVKGTMMGYFRRGLGAIATGVRKAARLPGLSTVAKLGTQIAITAYVSSMATPLFAEGALLAGGLLGLGVKGSAIVLGQLAGTLSLTVLSSVPKLAKGDVRGAARQIGNSITGFAIGQMVNMAGGPVGTFVGRISATVVGDIVNGSLWGFLIPTDPQALQAQHALQVSIGNRLQSMLAKDPVQDKKEQTAIKSALFNLYRIGQRVVLMSAIVGTLTAALYFAPSGIAKTVVSNGLRYSAKMSTEVFGWYKNVPAVRQFAHQLIGQALPTGWITRITTMLTERVMRRLKIENKHVVPDFIRKRIHQRIANTLLFELTYIQLLERIQQSVVNTLAMSVVARAGSKLSEYDTLEEAAKDTQANVGKAVESVQAQLKQLKIKAVNTQEKAVKAFNDIIQTALNAVGQGTQNKDLEAYNKRLKDLQRMSERPGIAETFSLRNQLNLDAQAEEAAARQAAVDRLHRRQEAVSRLIAPLKAPEIIAKIVAGEVTGSKSFKAQVMYEARLAFAKEAPEIINMIKTPGMHAMDGILYHVLAATGAKFLKPGEATSWKERIASEFTKATGYWDMMRAGLQGAKLTTAINAYYARKMATNNQESVSGWSAVSSAWSTVSSGAAKVMEKVWVPPSSKQAIGMIKKGVLTDITEASIEENVMAAMGLHPFKTQKQAILSVAVGDKPAEFLKDVAKTIEELRVKIESVPRIYTF